MLRIFAGIDAAEAPADKRGRAAGAVDDPLDACVDPLDDVGGGAVIEAEAPSLAAQVHGLPLNGGFAQKDEAGPWMLKRVQHDEAGEQGAPAHGERRSQPA